MEMDKNGKPTGSGVVKKVKVRNHNEWFRTVLLGNRKSCPNCGEKLNGESIWSWGEYLYGKWRTVKYFCKHCFPEQVQKPLQEHAGPCGCQITLCGRGDVLPDWLKLEGLCSV